MKKRALLLLGSLALLLLATLVIWQGSLDFGFHGPESSTEIVLFWAVSTLVFLLTVTLGFMLFRAGVRIWIERQTNREGSRIRTKLVVGALSLVFLPVIFLVVYDIEILNRTLDKWFSRPAVEVKTSLIDIGNKLRAETQAKMDAQARWLALRARGLMVHFAN